MNNITIFTELASKKSNLGQFFADYRDASGQFHLIQGTSSPVLVYIPTLHLYQLFENHENYKNYKNSINKSIKLEIIQPIKISNYDENHNTILERLDEIERYIMQTKQPIMYNKCNIGVIGKCETSNMTTSGNAIGLIEEPKSQLKPLTSV